MKLIQALKKIKDLRRKVDDLNLAVIYGITEQEKLKIR